MHFGCTQTTFRGTPSQIQLKDLIVARLQQRNGCTPAMDEPMVTVLHGLLTGCERKGRLTAT